MKNILMNMMIVLACALLSLSTIQAQTEIGIKAGINFATVNGDPTDIKGILTFGAGGFVRIAAGPQFSIQPEVLLTMKGAEEDFTSGEKVKLTYLEIPVLVVYQPPTTRNISPTLFVGPAVSLLMSAKSDDLDIKDDLKSTDLGLVLGAGIEFKSGTKGRIGLDGRYTLGLTNFNDVNPDDWTIKNGVFSLAISYIFPLGQ